jgi:hypothetical protein
MHTNFSIRMILFGDHSSYYSIGVSLNATAVLISTVRKLELFVYLTTLCQLHFSYRVNSEISGR